MNAKTETAPVDPLAKLREPFPPHQISKLPKPTKQQNEIVKNDFKAGIRCQVCGGWHHKDVVHLDYVGHAALTDRLLDADPLWSWEPVAFGADGLPATDRNGGMWIKLTVGGVTRLGYGNAEGKSGGDAVKELIGDALRNAAMRFGAALDLWHKGDLHAASEGEVEEAPASPAQAKATRQPATLAERATGLLKAITDAHDTASLEKVWALGAGLCADLDLKAPETLTDLTAAYEAKRDTLESTPFDKAA